MESHTEVALCAYSAELYNDTTGKIDGIASGCTRAMTFSTQDLIMRGGAALPTCSYFSRTSDMKNYLQWRPSNCPVGDWPMMLYLSTCGSVVCLPEVLGLYRVAVASSWTGRRSANADATAKFDKRMLGMIDELISKIPSEFHASLRAKQAEYYLILLSERMSVLRNWKKSSITAWRYPLRSCSTCVSSWSSSALLLRWA